MPRVKVRLNSAAMRALLSDPGVVADLKSRAERVLSSAESSAPVESGDYKASLHMEVVEHPTRTVVRVVADVPYAMNVEADHGTLSRALDAAG